MGPDCQVCTLLQNPQHQLLTTKFWTVGISNNQVFLGRAYVTLRTHKGSLSGLSHDEWKRVPGVSGQAGTSLQGSLWGYAT